MSRNIPNASEMGKTGGKKISEDRGAEYMREIGMRGNEAMKKLGTEFYKERARKIVESRKRNKRNRRSPLDKVASILNGS
jgi:hypothetical protein